MNKIYRLEGTKLISGFYGPNSLYDAYFDFDDNGKILINDLLSYFNNTAKYLKKDMEYNICFTADHLIKLEPGLNATISIYNDKGIKILLNPSHPTEILRGNNFKIMSDNDTMVYFYGKLNIMKQIKIDPNEKGKNIEIKIKTSKRHY